MNMLKSFVIIMYSVNAINLNLANLQNLDHQSKLIILWLLEVHPAEMSVARGKGSSCSKSSSLMSDINYSSTVF